MSLLVLATSVYVFFRRSNMDKTAMLLQNVFSKVCALMNT